MMGTLAAVLARDGISTRADAFQAAVEGDIEDVGGILRITEIRVTYMLRAQSGLEAAARRALGGYIEKCPAAQSVMGCIRIDHVLEFTPF